MYCAECGTKAEPGDLFCGECGARLETQDEVASAPDDTAPVHTSAPAAWPPHLSDVEHAPWTDVGPPQTVAHVSGQEATAQTAPAPELNAASIDPWTPFVPGTDQPGAVLDLPALEPVAPASHEAPLPHLEFQAPATGVEPTDDHMSEPMLVLPDRTSDTSISMARWDPISVEVVPVVFEPLPRADSEEAQQLRSLALASGNA